MIKVKITNKAGASHQRELPTDIYQLYHDMREAGISKPPKNILLHDDKDVEVNLSCDSEIGSRLMRLFGKNDTLADTNTVAFAMSTAREEILTDLEQNIIHNQYLTKEMLLDDIKAMTQAAGPVKLTFYCPLVGQLDDGEYDEYIDVGSGFLEAYQERIEQAIAGEQAPGMGDVAQYLGDDSGVAEKLMSAVWTVEDIDGKLFGRIDCHLKEPLTDSELASLRDEVLGQCSDGLCEGFEQRPIETDEGDLYVSYWNSSDDYFLCTEDELDEYLEPHHGMGGM